MLCHWPENWFQNPSFPQSVGGNPRSNHMDARLQPPTTNFEGRPRAWRKHDYFHAPVWANSSCHSRSCPCLSRIRPESFLLFIDYCDVRQDAWSIFAYHVISRLDRGIQYWELFKEKWMPRSSRNMTIMGTGFAINRCWTKFSMTVFTRLLPQPQVVTLLQPLAYSV